MNLQPIATKLIASLANELINQGHRGTGKLIASLKSEVDNININQITKFEMQYLTSIRDKGQNILASIREEKAISDENEEKLKAFLDEFMKTFSS